MHAADGLAGCPLCRCIIFPDPFAIPALPIADGDLIYAGKNGEPDLYYDGEVYLEEIDITEWLFTTLREYVGHAMQLLRTRKAWKAAQTMRYELWHSYRQYAERVLFLRINEGKFARNSEYYRVTIGEEMPKPQTNDLREYVRKSEGFDYLRAMRKSVLMKMSSCSGLQEDYEIENPYVPSDEQFWFLLRSEGYCFMDHKYPEFKCTGWFRLAYCTTEYGWGDGRLRAGFLQRLLEGYDE